MFTLPVLNGKLERVFSTLKVIKVDKMSSLSNEVLDDLLTLNTNCCSLKDLILTRAYIGGGKTRQEDQTNRHTKIMQTMPEVTMKKVKVNQMRTRSQSY